MVLANPPSLGHLDGIRMPHAKFHADPFKTVATHKKQRNIHTDRQTYIFGFINVR